MNVHIVCTDVSGRILPRLARCLARETGWTLGGTPNGRADVNLFIIYIDYAQSFPDFNATPTAAWFTHLETGVSQKEEWWHYAARGVDLRLTTARQYADILEPHGPTMLVRPPIDRDAFTIAPQPMNIKPIVGLSGFVPRRQKGQAGPGRKGVELVARLVDSELGQRIELEATGSGWPVRIQSTRDIDKLPKFYQGLHVFLCTSLIEGVPMPPLEALACGVPIVIPRGVGMLDDLPDIRGIYRYSEGDYQEMEKVLKRALVESALGCVDRDALRGATAEYTPQNWAGDMRRALESLLFDVSDTRDITVDGGNRGVYYVAYGGPARHHAKHGMETFKAHMNGVEVALVSDEPLGVEDIFIKHPDEDIGGRSAKTKIFDLAPEHWQYVMYLDADTEVVADISFLYQVLIDGWDMLICKNPSRFHTAANMVREDNVGECDITYKQMGTKEVIQLNGGVFAFQRNPRTARFFRAWHAEWQRWGKRDQAALLRALWTHPLKLYVLGNEWNTIPRYIDKRRTAGILHYPQMARRWRGTIHDRSDSSEAWRAVRDWEKGKKK